jgi:hypothetical protein
MTTPPVRVYRCGRCNRPFKADEQRTHSVWSGLSYCVNLDACGKRAKTYVDRQPMRWLPSVARS